MRRRQGSGALRRAGLTVLAILAGGCASMPGGAGSNPGAMNLGHLPQGSPLRSQSLQVGDMWARHHSMNASYDSLQEVLEPRARTAPKDVLQRDLQAAISLHLSGDYTGSNDLFEAAEREADVRYSKSVSQMGLSLVTSDKAVDFTPSRAEMAMIPYYRMHNYLRLGETDAALVEARKASSYFRQLEAENGDVCRSSTFLKYMTGLIYEMGGEMNDAVVSMRQAEVGYDACQDTYGFGPPASFGPDLHRIARRAGLSDVAADARKRYAVAVDAEGETGEVVVMIENGFVAHRMEQSVFFPLLKSEVAGLDPKDPVVMLATTAMLSGRLVGALVEQGVWGYTDEPEIRLPHGASLDDIYLMELSWPTYRLEANGAPGVRVRAGEVAGEAFVVQDISAEVVRDFEAVKRRVIGRTLARGLVKFLAADQLEKKVEAQNPLLGLLAGLGANLAANALESADTRSWSLLPDQLEMARLRLPAGEHEITVEVRDRAGEVVRTETVGTVTVRPGRTTMVNHRVWGGAPGERSRLARAAHGVEYDAFGDDDTPAPVVPAPKPAAPTPAAPAPAARSVAAPAAPQESASATSSEEKQATAPAPPTPAQPRVEATRHEQPAAAPRDLAVTQSLSIKTSHLLVGALGAEYERNTGRGSIGAVASAFTWDMDVQVVTLAARIKRYRDYGPAGLSISATGGLATVCNYWCDAEQGMRQYGIQLGGEAGYAWLFGADRNIIVKLDAGLQILALDEGDPETDGWAYTEPSLAMPSGGLSIGYVFR